jgi:hypothetical protein
MVRQYREGSHSAPSKRFLIERQQIRKQLNADVVIRKVTQGMIGGRLIDISEQGCKIELRHSQVSPGQKITIKLSDMELWSGQVIWTQGPMVGVLFERPMHPAVVDHLSRAHPTFKLD